ncbi:Heterogeneous nuclear ribonucleoprotein 1 [Morella rubra]|uniref:Heterogeneous nuclear ribonucleoprotein 1 n=1 Tax=Morella rubra TaxID=262757 RepID=A0A6A1V8R3_9ROSI|nr:Heterogeneous nuclear ribonucleoprotein 1 [Morella rubra]
MIMKDRRTHRPRGFGFIIYEDPSVVDQIEIKRTIPKGPAQANDFKTKKIYVGGIPTSVTEVVDNVLANGNMIDMAGTQVEIKKVGSNKGSNPALVPAFGSKSRARSYSDDFGGFGNSYSGFGPGSCRPLGSFGGSVGDYGGYCGANAFGGGYGDLLVAAVGDMVGVG